MKVVGGFLITGILIGFITINVGQVTENRRKMRAEGRKFPGWVVAVLILTIVVGAGLGIWFASSS